MVARLSRRFGSVSDDEVESSWRDFAEARVSIERDRNADRWIVSSETKSTFNQSIVNLIYVQRSAGFTQDHCGCLGNRAIEEPVVNGFDIVSQWRDIVTLGRVRLGPVPQWPNNPQIHFPISPPPGGP